MGSYVFKWPHPGPHHVYVTGTFDDWGKTEKLNKVGDVFEKEVNLPSSDEKVYYKFVVDDQWITDHAAPQEDDGHNNVNNVLQPHEIKRHNAQAADFGSGSSDRGLKEEEKVADAGSGSAPMPGAFETESAPMPGGFPEASATEEDRSAAGAPELPDRSHETTAPAPSSLTSTANPSDRSATYNAAAADKGSSGAPISGGDSFSVNPIPATSGIGNPIDLPAGERVPEPSEYTSNTVQSTATTSKEDYDRAGETTFPIAGVAAAGAVTAGALGASAFSAPDEKKNLIPESSLPMGGETKNTLDQGPFISSVGPGSTTADLASRVPLEQKRQGMVIDSDSPVPDIVKDSISKAHAEPEAAAYPEEVEEKAAVEKELLSHPRTIEESGVESTTGGGLSGVPAVVQESLSKANEEPEAAANAQEVQQKAALEQELLSKTSPVQDNGTGQTAPRSQFSYYGLATAVPKPVEESMTQAHASPEAAADTSVVREKEQLEQELLSKVPQNNETGEPAPTLTAATSTTAPTATTENKAAATATAITDGTTANETLPGTDTTTTTRGLSAGEVAGGAAVGTFAAVDTGRAIERHEDADAEPPRVADNQKPDITTEAAPATVSSTTVAPNIDVSSQPPGQSTGAAAAVADGADAGEVPLVSPSKAVVPETTEADQTEYAPLHTDTNQPGVSGYAAAAISDGTEDPTLADEPAVRMMNQHEVDTTPAVGTNVAETGVAPSMTSADPYLAATLPTATTDKDATGTVAAPSTPPKGTPQKTETGPSDTLTTGVPTLSSAGTVPETSQATTSTAGATPTGTPSKPAATGTASSASTPSRKMNETLRGGSPATSQGKEKKKKNRISGFFKKIFD